jgi:hypothetical protein
MYHFHLRILLIIFKINCTLRDFIDIFIMANAYTQKVVLYLAIQGTADLRESKQIFKFWDALYKLQAPKRSHPINTCIKATSNVNGLDLG